MPIQKYNPTTKIPKKTGTREATDSGTATPQGNAPKGTPSGVKKEKGTANMAPKKTLTGGAIKVASGGGISCPEGVQKFDPKSVGKARSY